MDDHEVRALERVIDGLQARFTELPRHVVTHAVMELYTQYESSRVRGYLAILIEREARALLSAYPARTVPVA